MEIIDLGKKCVRLQNYPLDQVKTEVVFAKILNGNKEGITKVMGEFDSLLLTKDQAIEIRDILIKKFPLEG